jgi:ubiquitin carboxyl-terminal hydrolase 47
LRKKHWRTPSTVYGAEEEVLDTELLYIFKNWEMFLQLLDVNNPLELSSNYRGAETVIFTRRWRPSTFTLEPFVDTPLAEFNRIVLGRKLSEVSGLKPEQIEIAKAPGTFPCEGSLLGIHDDITWVPLLTTGSDDDGSFKYPCSVQTDGDVVYWREKGEPLKKLTEQERREILSRENTDSTASGTSYSTVSASPRKERPLRIFIDSPKSSSVKETIEPDLD